MLFMENDSLLTLLQLADSALPIGVAAHSFGLESLIAEGWLRVEGLETFLRDYLAEAGKLECTFCLQAHSLGLELASDEQSSTYSSSSESTREQHPHDLSPYHAGRDRFLQSWPDLNARLSAFKTARESRQASITLGRRFLQLACNVEAHPFLPAIANDSRAAHCDIHHSVAFGLVCGLCGVSANNTGQGYLQQVLTGLISACQRLLPLGQSQASRILWLCHTAVQATVQQSIVAAATGEICSFTGLLDLASMRHPALEKRLFIS
jgi:urease accessory protein